jgi:hypothetical protein
LSIKWGKVKVEALIQKLHYYLDLIIDHGDEETQNRILNGIMQSGEKILEKKLSRLRRIMKK